MNARRATANAGLRVDDATRYRLPDPLNARQGARQLPGLELTDVLRMAPQRPDQALFAAAMDWQRRPRHDSQPATPIAIAAMAHVEGSGTSTGP